MQTLPAEFASRSAFSPLRVRLIQAAGGSGIQDEDSAWPHFCFLFSSSTSRTQLRDARRSSRSMTTRSCMPLQRLSVLFAIFSFIFPVVAFDHLLSCTHRWTHHGIMWEMQLNLFGVHLGVDFDYMPCHAVLLQSIFICFSRAFYDKRISQEVSGDALGEEFKGYVFKIMGGCDKQGFPMKQGVLTTGRVRLLLHRGTPCFRGYGRRNGERRRKSVRGCIVSPDLSVLNLVIVKKGENDLPGLTDIEKPRMRGPKRASKIRKLFNLSKEDDVRKYVNTYRRTFTTKTGKKRSKAPKIQRLVTPLTLQRKRSRISEKKKRIAKAKSEAADYQKLLASRLKEQRERRSESLAKRRSKLSAASKPSVAA
ncbi:hypothetical protein ZIOFF_066726 [Zingiber officinale]|uniref:40S ribosomal protein S6 n=1 Tax=Zingiber officinale TaxID=94328 RepID=A0A8J5F3V3_ZINOF|nr:hypothetical protein ZIOFF_066726 [Zingiber officinale]